MRPEDLPRITASHLVKSIDLNHHGTLFAGRMAEWLVETGFMTARAALGCPPENIVCVRLNGMDFREPVHAGDTLVLEGRTVMTGRSSITVFVNATVLRGGEAHPTGTEGFATFVHIVDSKGAPHGVTLDPPESAEAQKLAAVAESMRQR